MTNSPLTLSISWRISSLVQPSTRLNGASVKASSASRQWKSMMYPISLSRRSLGHGPTGTFSCNDQKPKTSYYCQENAYLVCIVTHIHKPSIFQPPFHSLSHIQWLVDSNKSVIIRASRKRIWTYLSLASFNFCCHVTIAGVLVKVSSSDLYTVSYSCSSMTPPSLRFAYARSSRVPQSLIDPAMPRPWI